jgi:hypothetical protein
MEQYVPDILKGRNNRSASSLSYFQIKISALFDKSSTLPRFVTGESIKAYATASTSYQVRD